MKNAGSIFWIGIVSLAAIGIAGCGKQTSSDGGTNGTEQGELGSKESEAVGNESQSKKSGLEKAVSNLKAAFEESDRSVSPVVSMVRSGQYEAARLTLREIQGPELKPKQKKAVEAMFREIKNR